MKRFSLFIKIYLSFLLITIIVATALVYLDHLTGSGPVIKHWQQTVDRTLLFYGGEAVRIYDHEGAPALKDFFTRLEGATGIRGFLFDSEGVEISGRAIDNDVKKMALAAVNHSTTGASYPERFGLVAERVKGAKATYVFAVLFHKPPPPGSIPDLIKGPLHGPPPPGPHPEPHLMLPPGPPPNGLSLHFYVRLIIALIVSGLACFLLARYLTSPILTLSHAARQLAAGNLSVRVGHLLGVRKDELSGLAADFDLMAERIESLLVSQRNLLRDVSHELRSPLARLNVALELCRQRFGSEGEKPLDRIEQEAGRLNELIGQILTFNRIETGTAAMDKADVQLDELLEEVVADANFETGQVRTVILHKQPCIVDGNRDLLRRAIENTVRNALYHTPADGKVEIALSSLEQRDGKSVALITVRDYGRGVPEESLPLIFKPFYKVSEGGEFNSGTGLGLAITEAAIRQHGGSISARNASGGGLVIEMVIPLKS